MNFKAALLALVTLLGVFPLDSFAQIVPWQGIKNTIFNPLEQTDPVYECGFQDDLAAIFSRIKFRPATNSVFNTDPDLAASLWASSPMSALPPVIEKRAILRRIETKGPHAPKLTISENENLARVGHRLGQGDRVKTPNLATVDFFLGNNGPLLHVHENTLLGFTRLDLEDTGFEHIIDTRLHLHRGRITGNVKKLAPRSTYLIRTQSNLIRVTGSEYQIDANGACAMGYGTAEIITPTHIHTVNGGEKYSPTAPAER